MDAFSLLGRCTECGTVPNERSECDCTGYSTVPESEWDYDPYE